MIGLREGGDDDFSVDADDVRRLVASGMPREQARLLLASQAHLDGDGAEHRGKIRIRPDDEKAVLLFQEVCWQWRTVAGFSGVRYLGLDRTTYEPAMRWLGIAPDEHGAVAEKMRIMESAARTALHDAQSH